MLLFQSSSVQHFAQTEAVDSSSKFLAEEDKEKEADEILIPRETLLSSVHSTQNGELIFVEEAMERVGEEAEVSECTRSSTPVSSFQLIRSRLIRPFPAATTSNLPQVNESSSQHIHRSREAEHTHFVVNLAEGEELELEDESCRAIPLSSFQQSCDVAATPPVFHPSQSFPQHMNDINNHFASDNFVIKLAEEREEATDQSSSAPPSSFQLIQQRLIRPSPTTQPALVSLHQSNQCSLKRIISHFAAHDGTLKKAGTLINLVQKLVGEKDEEAADEINSSTPLSSFQLIHSRLIRPSPSTSVQCSSASGHHLTPLSVYQDRLRHMQPVRSIVRGDMCRRRLFSKCIDLKEAATVSVPRAAKRARIEDYVDIFLLSEAAQKMRFLCHKQEELHCNSSRLDSNLARGSSSFDWPSADLQVMTTSTPTDCHPFITDQQFLTKIKDDDLQIKQYTDVCHKSRRALFQQDMKNQDQMYLMKDKSSQFSSCGWSIRGYDHDHDGAYHSHHSVSITDSSVAQYGSDFRGVILSTSTPPDSFQSFDTTVRLFQA